MPHSPAPAPSAHQASPVAPHTGSEAISHGQSTKAEAGPVQVKPKGGKRCRTPSATQAAGKSHTRHCGTTLELSPAATAHSVPRKAPMPTRPATAAGCGSPP